MYYSKQVVYFMSESVGFNRGVVHKKTKSAGQPSGSGDPGNDNSYLLSLLFWQEAGSALTTSFTIMGVSTLNKMTSCHFLATNSHLSICLSAEGTPALQDRSHHNCLDGGVLWESCFQKKSSADHN